MKKISGKLTHCLSFSKSIAEVTAPLRDSSPHEGASVVVGQKAIITAQQADETLRVLCEVAEADLVKSLHLSWRTLWYKKYLSETV